MPRRFRNATGPAIRRLRMERGWSQQAFAGHLLFAGIEEADRVWVAKVESQIRSVFDFELAVIAAVLGVKADDLLPKARELKRDLPALQKGEK